MCSVLWLNGRKDRRDHIPIRHHVAGGDAEAYRMRRLSSSYVGRHCQRRRVLFRGLMELVFQLTHALFGVCSDGLMAWILVVRLRHRHRLDESTRVNGRSRQHVVDYEINDQPYYQLHSALSARPAMCNAEGPEFRRSRR